MNFASYDPAIADTAVEELKTRGFASLPVPAPIASTVKKSFDLARPAFDVLEDGPPALGRHTKDSANASGSHRIGALSNYNACREGFVFSNGASFPVKGIDGFESATTAFFAAALQTARALLAAIERRLGLPKDWFEDTLGPLSSSSQWHLKRYRPEAAPQHAVTEDGKLVLLAVHSDPSLVSLVFHDAAGKQPGARGLECQRQNPPSGTLENGSETVAATAGAIWDPVPFHGHSVVTVLGGSVLDKLTGGHFRAIRHRVAVPRATHMESGQRIAATFFFRPSPSAVLLPPPSPLLPPPSGGAAPMKYSEWQRKVADKYERHAAAADFRHAKHKGRPGQQLGNGTEGCSTVVVLTLTVTMAPDDFRLGSSRTSSHRSGARLDVRVRF